MCEIERRNTHSLHTSIGATECSQCILYEKQTVNKRYKISIHSKIIGQVKYYNIPVDTIALSLISSLKNESEKIAFSAYFAELIKDYEMSSSGILLYSICSTSLLKTYIFYLLSQSSSHTKYTVNTQCPEELEYVEKSKV